MKLEHPHILTTRVLANQNGDEYLLVCTDVEVEVSSRPGYDAKLAAELEELVRQHIGKGPPFYGRFGFNKGLL